MANSGLNFNKKVLKCLSWLIPVSLVLILVGIPLLSWAFNPPLLGTGSYKHAKQWKDKSVTCNSLDDVRKQFNCGRYQVDPGESCTYIRDPNTFKEGNTSALLYDFANGDWLAMAYANSHNTWGGGTVVTRDNKGMIRVFFGHVCGRPHVVGQSLEDVYACFNVPQWKEVSIK